MRRFYVRESGQKKPVRLEINDHLTFEQVKLVFSRLADMFYHEKLEAEYEAEIARDHAAREDKVKLFPNIQTQRGDTSDTRRR